MPVVGGDDNSLIRRHHSMLAQHLGVTPIVKKFDYTLKSQVLELSFDNLSELHHIPDGEVFIDVRAATTPEEKAYARLFTGFEENDEELLITVLCKLDEAIRQRIYVITDMKVESLKTIKSPKNLEELVLMEGYSLAPSLPKFSKAISKVVGWKEAEGITFISLGERVKGKKSFLSPEQCLHLVN